MTKRKTPATPVDQPLFLNCPLCGQSEGHQAECPKRERLPSCPGCGYDKGHLDGCPDQREILIAGPDATLEEVGQILADRAVAELEELPDDEAPIRFEAPSEPVEAVLRHTTAKLFGQIAKTMADLGTIKWDARNTESGGYRYTSIDTFLAAVRPVMAKNGLVLVTEQHETGVSSYSTRNGAVGLLDSTWKFTIASAVEDRVYLGPFALRAVANASMGAQAYGAVMSYAIKNFLRGQFLIATGDEAEDVDKTKGQQLAARPREVSGPKPPPVRNDPAPRRNDPPVPRDDDDRIPRRSTLPAGNGAPASGARPAVFKLRARIQRTGNAGLQDRILAKFHPAATLEELTDEQIEAAHARLTEVGVAALKIPS